MKKLNPSPSYSDEFDDYARNPNVWVFEAQCQMAAANILFDRFDRTLLNGKLKNAVVVIEQQCFTLDWQ